MRYWIIIVFVGFLIPSLCFGWLTGYGYRREVWVKCSKDVTDYQVSFEFNHDALTPAKAQADGDDIRITTSGDVEIARCLDPASWWDSTATKIWFKATVGTPDSTLYYLYYGNSEATPPSWIGDSVFVAYDDFSQYNYGDVPTGADGWTEQGTASGSTYVDSLQYIGKDKRAAKWYQVNATTSYQLIWDFPDITADSTHCVEWWVMVDVDEMKHRDILTQTLLSTTNSDYGMLNLWEMNGTNRLQIYQGGWVDWKNVSLDTWYHMKAYNFDITGSSDTYTLALNDTSDNEAMAYNISDIEGFQIRGNTSDFVTIAWYDGFIVRKHTIPEPTVSVGDEGTPGTPGWWDDNYLSRKQIYFGNDHEVIDSLDTVQLLLPTGNTQVIYNRGLSQSIHPWNTSVANKGNYLCAAYIAPAKQADQAKLRIFVGDYDTSLGIWKTQYDVAGVLTEHDHHFSPSICIDTAGYLHLFYGCHLSDLKYRKSTNPLDASAWGAEGEIHDDFQATYPRCYVDTSGDINVWFRGPISRQYGVSISSDGGSSWARDTIIWEDSTIEAQPAYGYVNAIAWYDSTIARTHLAYTWRQNLPVEFEGHKHLAYAYLDDTSSKWKQRDGTEQTVPMKISNADIIYTSIGDTCNSVASICGNPDVASKCIIQFWEWPGDDREQSDTVVYKVAYYDAGSWQIRTIATYAQPGNWNRSGIARTGSGANDTLHIFMKKQADDNETTELAW